MKKILICLNIILLLSGCGSKEKEPVLTKEEQVSKIIEQNNYIVVDVRTKEEYESGHIKDSINIPYDEIEESVALDKNKTILVYCRSGKRSATAYNTLKKLGYDVFDLGAYDTITLEKVK